MDKYRTPQYLDEPLRIMLLTIDELVVFILPFLLALLLFNQPVLGGVIGGVLVFILKKIKGEQGHYFVYNLIYWYLPQMVRFKVTPPSYLRMLLG